ncbi:uncharacterized protein EDB93DRAFT_1249545 [Suillus bovinus]|uniref:uncharacterized protein n=1 Tax=Suillus bovinus TaxID=48563 RepID=UPI001B8709E9|nr:uncharacterized protein EDB93DRAFT_1249545 [Suillus bovinus]KAG2151050.1 hypothetical protein EDB93DRAFT_1249545 [Suillus bovinus]
MQVQATTQQRHSNEPLLLQYTHRVLKQHPVDLTFFFVPQVVQALRFDLALGRPSIISLKGLPQLALDVIDVVEKRPLRSSVLASISESPMAAYSVACYILQIKDHHNGNIVHIDFGFLFDIDELFISPPPIC